MCGYIPVSNLVKALIAWQHGTFGLLTFHAFIMNISSYMFMELQNVLKQSF